MEFLSVTYYKDRLLSVIPKCWNQFKMVPSDLGWSADIMTSIAKVNNLIMNGGTF